MAYKLEEHQVGFSFSSLVKLGGEMGGHVPQKPQMVRCEARIVEVRNLGEGVVIVAKKVTCKYHLLQVLDYHLTTPTAHIYLSMLAPIADFGSKR